MRHSLPLATLFNAVVFDAEKIVNHVATKAIQRAVPRDAVVGRHAIRRNLVFPFHDVQNEFLAKHRAIFDMKVDGHSQDFLVRINPTQTAPQMSNTPETTIIVAEWPPTKFRIVPPQMAATICGRQMVQLKSPR